MFACPVAPTKDKRNQTFQIVDLAQFCDLVAMALIDSEKAFQKRCEEMHDGLFEKLQGQNIGSFSTLAFALGSQQNPVSDDEFTKLADAVFETQSTLGTTAILRVALRILHPPYSGDEDSVCMCRRFRADPKAPVHREAKQT